MNHRTPDVLRHEPEALIYARRVTGMTQAELARKISVTRSLINELEAGTRSASVAVLNKLTEALGCPLVVLERKRVVVEPKRVVA